MRTSSRYPPSCLRSPHRRLLTHPSSHLGYISRPRNSSVPPRPLPLETVRRRFHSAIICKGKGMGTGRAKRVSYVAHAKCNCSPVACGTRMSTAERVRRCTSRLYVPLRARCALAPCSLLWALALLNVLRVSSWGLRAGGTKVRVSETRTRTGTTGTTSATRVLWRSKLHRRQAPDSYRSAGRFHGPGWFSERYGDASNRRRCLCRQYGVATDVANVAMYDRHLPLLPGNLASPQRNVVLRSLFLHLNEMFLVIGLVRPSGSLWV